MSELKEGYYYLVSEHEDEPTLAHGYYNHDAKAFGFGFNIYDGGGFLPLSDVSPTTDIVPVSITSGLNASEAIFGFCGWLTTRSKAIVMSSKHDAAPIADMIKAFCEYNSLPEPVDGWDNKLKHPKESETND